MLQLGRKYQIQKLRQEALTRLECYFPPRLEDFKNRFASDWEGRDPDDEVKVFSDDAIEDVRLCDTRTVIILARSLHIPALLLPAFYLAAQSDILQVFEDHIDVDGVYWKLDVDDTRRIIVGQEALRKRSLEFLGYITKVPSPHCARKQICAGVLYAILRTELKVAHHDTRALVHAAWIEDAGLCSICTDFFVSYYELQRRQTWSELAGYFDLKGVKWPVTNRTGVQVCFYS